MCLKYTLEQTVLYQSKRVFYCTNNTHFVGNEAQLPRLIVGKGRNNYSHTSWTALSDKSPSQYKANHFSYFISISAALHIHLYFIST